METKQMSEVEGNMIIAEFMGVAHGDIYEMFGPDNYDLSWDSLMPVIEKIEKIHDDFHGYFGVHICSNSCTIQGTNLRTDKENFHPAYISDPNAILETKIKSTWYNIVQFILWHNSIKNK